MEADSEEMETSPVSSRQVRSQSETETGRVSRLSLFSNNSFSLNTSSFPAKAALSQRIVSVEYYMALAVKDFDNTYSDFRHSTVKRVPVIRIFGSTPAGQKMCSNIHGVYPYISILDDGTQPGFDYRVAEALDNAINDSVNTNKFAKGQNRYQTQHVFKITRVVGRTFYGFRSNNEVFLRIFFYNPLILKKAVDLLQSGSILGRRFQPYEAHIPYILQFMIDYSLYGMNFVHFARMKFRKHTLIDLADLRENEENERVYASHSQSSNCSLDGYFDPDNIDPEMLAPPQLSKMTRCELEVDVLASDILDVKESGKTVSANPGINAIWNDEVERRRQQDVSNCSQITIPESQERSRAQALHSTEKKHQQLLWSKVESFFEHNEIDSQFLSSQSQSQNSSMLAEAEVLSSSQIVDHLTDQNDDHAQNDIQNNIEEDEDEFVMLLEDMAKDAAAQNEIEENPHERSDDGTEGEVEVDAEANENESDDLWDDSFISQSILDKISEAELSYEVAQADQQDKGQGPSRKDKEIEIIQCDGQGGDDSDSSSDDDFRLQSSSRRSSRSNLNVKTEEKQKEVPPVASTSSSSIRKSLRLSRGETGSGRGVYRSPGDRLSLTYRRQSRSQELLKSNQESKSNSPTVAVRPSRRSISAHPQPQPAQSEKSKTNPKATRSSAKLATHEPPTAITTNAEKKSELKTETVTSKKKNVKAKPASNTKSQMVSSSSSTAETVVQSSQTQQKQSTTTTTPTKTSVKKTTDSVIMDKIKNSQPRIFLTKIDPSHSKVTNSTNVVSSVPDLSSSSTAAAASSLPKRTRKKPKRFLLGDGDDGISTCSSQSSSTSAQAEPSHNQTSTTSPTLTESESPQTSTSVHADRKILVSVPPPARPKPKTSKQLRKESESKKPKLPIIKRTRSKLQLQPQEPKKEAVPESEAKTAETVKSNSKPKPVNQAKNQEKITNDPHSNTSSSSGQKNSGKRKKKRLGISMSVGKPLPVKRKSTAVAAPPPPSPPRTPSSVTVDVVTKSPAKSSPSPPRKVVEETAEPKEVVNQQVGVRTTTEMEVMDGDEISIFEYSQTDIVMKSPEAVKVVKYSDVGVSCSPSMTNRKQQTEQLQTANACVQVVSKPSTVTIGTQTESPMKTSCDVQTDAVPNLCLCQCKCVHKSKTDVSQDVQDDLKPQTETKRIQVDNMELLTRARSVSRFSTPQSNRIKNSNTTPSRSPEKRRPYHHHEGSSSGGRRSITPNRSRYLSAIYNIKTPTSHHKHFNRMLSPNQNLLLSTPPEFPNDTTDNRKGPLAKLTPPSRESREDFLVQSIKSVSRSHGHGHSHSPRKRLPTFKPRNLEVESQRRIEEEKRLVIVLDQVSGPSECQQEEGNDDDGTSQTELFESELDLSINSVYEYEDDPNQARLSFLNEVSPSPAAANETPEQAQGFSTPTTTISQESEESPPSSAISIFQKKKILSKHRSKSRIERRKSANLEANRGIPDVFEIEYEPLKQPPSFKSTLKWLEAERNGTNEIAESPSYQKAKVVAAKAAQDSDDDQESSFFNDDSSDEEEGPLHVRLFGGGNLSDDDEEDSDAQGNFLRNGNDAGNDLRPFTPTECVRNGFVMSSQRSSADGTPRSILRPSSSAGSSRRLTRLHTPISKRKIRWEDTDEPTNECKRLKLEDDFGTPLSQEFSQSVKTADTSELDGPALKNALGLENSLSNFQDVKAVHQCQFLTTMCIEVHCASRNGLIPDPALDPILAIFVLISSDYPENFRKPKEFLHMMVIDNHAGLNGSSVEYNPNMKAFKDEASLINGFIQLVRSWDPDIFVGYEVEKSSFGYLIQRGVFHNKNMADELSRLLPPPRPVGGGKEFLSRRNKDEWNGTICGRIVLNLWRLLRHEIAVQSYTFENAAYHILHRRVHKFSYQLLNDYWTNSLTRAKVIHYYMIRIRGVIQMLDKLDLINRTSELARLFGIQFYEVLSRGSQFRVESMMLRATKPLDYIAPSPTITQRAKMRAPEFLPLIMEPHSNYYTDPVAVLDFQSLYPSMMIAYNYDYASLLGRVEHLGGSLDRFAMGCLDHQVSPSELLHLKDHIHVSPAGVAFLDKSMVKGVLPEMLEQILDTRQMVKRAMKKWKNEGASLQKVLDSRQLGLKLIANVTYGYTSANFSGRMPCVEIADSIVSKGRETLQRAIELVKANFHRWGGDVVYGDTDSMFVLFRGKSREEAFKIAYEIADEVTQANPKPVKLKFEKIYQPCILQTKKRYVGYSYETPDQKKPIYDAKGIETVRRDGCPAVRKILEKTIHVLFTSNNPKRVEDYVKLQFEKLFKGRVSVQDYIFAKEFRGREGYRPTACVPSLEIAKKLVLKDPRAEPLVKERVPYVVIYGNPSLPLIKLVRTPDEFFRNPTLRLNAHYYIEKVIIPALNRCLQLAGMNAQKWYLQLPRKYLRNVLDQKNKNKRQGTLDNYILHQNCLRCDGRAEHGLCRCCLADQTTTVVYLQEIVRNSKSKLNACTEICSNCAGVTDQCISIDCPILHKLTRYQRDQPHIRNVEGVLQKLEW